MKTYHLVQGDDIRTVELTLTSDETPASAKLRLRKTGSSDVTEFTLTEEGAVWTYRFTDADFAALGSGTFKAEVYATFDDDTNGTYPTRGHLTVVIRARL